MVQDAEKIITQISGLSYLGIFGVALVANVLFIIPEEVVLLSMGYVARAGNVNIFIMIPIVILGLLTSDIVVYYLSRRGSKFITSFYENFFSKRLKFFTKHSEGKGAWMETNIEKVIFYSRFLMQLRFLGPFMAGKLKVSQRKFLVYELAALVIYVPLLLWTGWYFHSKVSLIIGKVEVVRNAILLCVGLMIVYALLQIVYRSFMKRTNSDHEQSI